MIRCPACTNLLYRRVVGGVTLDGCPSCGGAFADRGELQTLAKDPAGLKMVDEAFPVGVAPKAGAPTSQCPKCEGSALVEFEFNTFRGVRLSRCKSCEGVWMDHGKPAAISAVLASHAPVAAPAASSVSPSVAARFGQAVPAPATMPIARAAAAAPQGSGGDPTRTSHLPLVRGVVVGSYDHSPGFFGSLERGLRFIKGAYALAAECPRLLLPMAIGAAVQIAVLALLVGGALLMTRGVRAAGHPPFEGSQVALALVGMLFALVFQIGNMVVLGMTVSLVDAYLKGRTPDLGTAWRDVLGNASGVLVMAAVSAIVNSLTHGRNGRRGIIGGLVDAAWKVLVCLLMPIIMIEDIGFLDALKRAREIHSRGLLQIAVGEVGLRAIAGISGMAIGGVLGLLAMVAVPAGTAGIVGLVLVGGVLLVALGILHAFARGAYYTCLYLWAVEVERAGDPARALVPAPLAAALMG